MRIAIIVNSFPNVTETFILNQIKFLLSRGHSVHIFADRMGNTEIIHESIQSSGLLNKVSYRSEIPKRNLDKLIFFWIWIIGNLQKINWCEFYKTLKCRDNWRRKTFLKMYFLNEWFLNKPNFKIIHAHFGPNGKKIAYLKKKGLLNNSKLIVSFHGYDLNIGKISFYRLQYQEIFNHSNALTINSFYSRKILKSIIPTNKDYVLPVGLDTNYFKSSPKESQKHFVMIFCGRLIALKGPHICIEILIELRNRGYDVRLEIIGAGELFNNLEKKIRDLKLNEYVNLRGALKQDQVKNLMSKSSIFILPGIKEKGTGRAETQGLVIQEAQAMELPVIISDVGGMKYGMIDRVTGFVVKENDIKGFANSIEGLILNEELRIDMGKRGRAFVVENYDSFVLGNKLIEIYNT